MIELQYDFFKDPMESRLSEMEKAISDSRLSLDKQRKSQFAKIGEIRKLVMEISARLDILEKNICSESNQI